MYLITLEQLNTTIQMLGTCTHPTVPFNQIQNLIQTLLSLPEINPTKKEDPKPDVGVSLEKSKENLKDKKKA